MSSRGIGDSIPFAEPCALAQCHGRSVPEKSLYFLLGAVLVVKRDIERLSACIDHFIIIRKLPSVLTEMGAVVLPDGIKHSSCRKLMLQFHFEKTNQHKCQKTGGKVCVNMSIRPNIDRAGFKEGFGYLEGVFNSGKTAIDLLIFSSLIFSSLVTME